MVAFHFFNSPSTKPLKVIEVFPNCTDLSTSKNSCFLPKSNKKLSVQPLTSDPNSPSKHIKLLINLSTAWTSFRAKHGCSSSPEQSTPSISSRGSLSILNGSKFCQSNRCADVCETPKEFQLKLTDTEEKFTKLSPITLHILARIFKYGPSEGIMRYTSFIKFLGNCGYANEATELFALMKEAHNPDVISFTVIIRILCDSKQLDQALDLIQEMPLYKCKPDIYFYNILIDKLGEAGCEELVHKFWSEMQLNGIHPDIVTYASLLKSLCIRNKIEKALHILEQMEINTAIKLNTYVYNTIIKYFLDHRQVDEALRILRRMEIHGCDPDLCSFNLFIKFFGDLGNGVQAYMFFKDMISRGIEASEGSYRLCVLGLVKEGKLREVIELIEKIKNSSVCLDLNTANRLIMWLGKMGRLEEAHGFFIRMKEPNEITMNIVIHMFYEHGLANEAWKVFTLMKEMEIGPSIVTYNILINGLGKEGRVHEAFELVQWIKADQHLLPDVITYNCLLDGLCKAGKVNDACKVVAEMISSGGCPPDLISYNTLINGLIRKGRTEDASRLFQHLREELGPHTVPLKRLLNEMVEQKM